MIHLLLLSIILLEGLSRFMLVSICGSSSCDFNYSIILMLHSDTVNCDFIIHSSNFPTSVIKLKSSFKCQIQ
uniref:Secreted protein n=1 Tax=Kalanchoe fedtschenkoi TaxID=63787 RepID=A0A7N0UYH0_KALFE